MPGPAKRKKTTSEMKEDVGNKKRKQQNNKNKNNNSNNGAQQGTDFNPTFSFDASGLDSAWGSQQPWSFTKIRQDFEKAEQKTQVSRS